MGRRDPFSDVYEMQSDFEERVEEDFCKMINRVSSQETVQS